MKVVVVGATGNVGTALLRRLLTAPEVSWITGVARRAPDPASPPYGDVEWRATDVSDRRSVDDLTSAMDGAAAVVHLAWLVQPSHDERMLRATNVDGTRHVLDAAVRAGVPHVVVASSVGAYAMGPKDHPVDERWPTTGVPASGYSRHKALVERMLDDLEGDPGGPAVARLRPGLVFQGSAGSEIGRYFLGSLVPLGLLGRVPLPVVPLSRSMVFQAVHADDCADAYWRVVHARASGAWNVAADPPLGPDDLAAALRGRPVLVPTAVLRVLARGTWLARAQPTSPGWVDLAAAVPVMDTTRIRAELGWRPGRTPREALAELVDGLATGRGSGSVPMRPRRPAARH